MFAFLPPNLDWQFFVIAVPVMLFWWSGVMAMISFVGGWHGLGKLYRREETRFSLGDGRAVETFRWASLKMGPHYFPTNYGNCVNIGLSDEGVGLSVVILFRPMHPPLLIPWSAIESCQLGKELRFFDCATLQLQGVANPIRVYGRAGRAIESHFAAIGGANAKSAR